MRKYSGLLIVATLLLYLFSILVPSILFVPVILAWVVPVLMWKALGKGAVKQALFLLTLGLLAILFSASQGVFLGWKEVFAANLPLLAMFVAVAFLSLTNQTHEDSDLPQGNLAVVSTALGTHLLGSVINLSVLFVFGDRMRQNGSLTKAQMIILARSFCAAAWWSPFFIATGVALTYAPEMSWKESLVPGSIMSAIAISYCIIEVCYFRKSRFSGYPIQLESLGVPLFLAAVVISVHHFWHEIHILQLICVVAPLGGFVFMKRRPRQLILKEFVNNGILSVINQFVLFLAAGVFSAGIKSIVHIYPYIFTLEGSSFTPLLFFIILGTMILVGIIGVHPIVSIAIVSPLLLPLNPDHSQLGFLFLSSWAISTGSSPLSGVGLALVGRYQASPRGILMANWHYALMMCVVASVINFIFFVS